MKLLVLAKTTALVLLVALHSACQQDSSGTGAASPTELVNTSTVPASSLPSVFEASDTLTAPMLALARRYDFGKLWQGGTKQRESPVLEGVFGPDHYRFELVINQAVRQPQRPYLYQVRGKCHYRKNVRPFTGWLTIRSIDALAPPYHEDDGSFGAAIRPDSVSPDSFEAREARIMAKVGIYQMRAEIQLTEQPAANSGELRGEALLNFYVAPPGRLGYVMAALHPGDGIWREGTVLLRGSRRNLTTKQIKQFTVSDNVFVAAAYVYKDFGIGDRGYESEINKKYAHLGWNEKWENEEWWAESPKPRLNL
jgi:hypothetical protein